MTVLYLAQNIFHPGSPAFAFGLVLGADPVSTSLLSYQQICLSPDSNTYISLGTSVNVHHQPLLGSHIDSNTLGKRTTTRDMAAPGVQGTATLINSMLDPLPKGHCQKM
jgi:hypothetical protein